MTDLSSFESPGVRPHRQPSAPGVSYALGNGVIALWLSGAVVFISTHLTQIPVAAFIGLFTLLTLGCLAAGWHFRQRQDSGWMRTAAYWAGIFYGIAVIAAAQRLDLLSFIPDLILVWIVGLLWIATVLPSPIVWGLAQSLALVWLLCTFLYGQTYAPGVGVWVWVTLSFTPVLSGGVAPGRLRTGLHLAYTVVLCHLLAYGLLVSQHYPLHVPAALPAVSAASFALWWALGQSVRLRERWPRLARWLGRVGLSAGVIALVAGLLLGGPTAALSGDQADPLGMAWGLVVGLLSLAAVVCISAGPQARVAGAGWGLWALGVLLALLGLTEPLGVVGTHFTALTEVLTLLVGLMGLMLGVRRPCLYRLLGGVALLALALGSVWARSGMETPWAIGLLWLLAAVLAVASLRYSRATQAHGQRLGASVGGAA